MSTYSATDIIGTWSMVEAWDIPNSKQPNEKTYPWGNPSAGYWVFDKSGHFSLMISKNPPLSALVGNTSDNTWLNPPTPQKVPRNLLIETFVDAQPYAYFGTYTVDLDDYEPHLGGTLNLSVISDVLRVYTNTVQQRNFIFDGHDYLNVGDPNSYLRRLKRLT